MQRALPRHRDPDPRRSRGPDRPRDPAAAGNHGAARHDQHPLLPGRRLRRAAADRQSGGGDAARRAGSTTTLMQAIAAENNLSETAFTVPSDSDDADYDLRWFTPTDRGRAVRPCDARRRPCPDDRPAGALFDRVGRADRHAAATTCSSSTCPPAKLTEVQRAGAVRGARACPTRPAWLADGCNDAAIIEVADEAAVRAVAPDFAALRQDPSHGGASPRAATPGRSPAACSSPISGSTRTR